MRIIKGLAVLLFLTVILACSGPASFQGTALAPGDLAPPFRLHDQYGSSVALSDLAGKVVVLAFLYTHCPDVCPVTTETLRRTHQLLGDDTARVEFVAISVDPGRDSVERAYLYSEEKDMLDRWHFLVGDEDQLEPVWRSYWLDPIRDVGDRKGDTQDDHNDGEATGATSAAQADAIKDSIANTYLISHTAPVFLIDQEGYRRVLFTNLFLDPHPLLHDIRLLIR